MALPVIGLTASRSASSSRIPIISTNEAYIQAILLAGGLPFLIPPNLPPDRVGDFMKNLQGLLLTGGGDIAPHLYHGNHHPRVYDVDPGRDSLEIALVKQAVDANLPFLGICRGIQVINVAMGGTLYTDIGDQLPGALKHDSPAGEPRDRIAHNVEISPGSLLIRIVAETSLPVNSLHHQGIFAVAPSLVPTACAPDGLIETVEVQNHPFGLGIQWHPEWLPEDKAMQAIFRGFIQAAGNA